MFHFSLFFCFAAMGPIPIFILSILLLFLFLLLLPLVLLTLPRVSTVSETKIFASSHNHSPPSLFKTLLYLLLKGFPSELQYSLSSLPSHLLLLPVSPSPQPLRPWTVMPGVFKKEAEDFHKASILVFYRAAPHEHTPGCRTKVYNGLKCPEEAGVDGV